MCIVCDFSYNCKLAIKNLNADRLLCERGQSQSSLIYLKSNKPVPVG